MGQQTSLKTVQDLAFAGKIVDLKNHDIESHVSEESSAEMPFGVMLKSGTLADQALLVAAQADKSLWAGVLVHSAHYNKDNQLGTTGVKPNQPLNVMRRGTIWVTTEDAVTALSDPVRVRAVATGAEEAGAFRTAADGTDTVDISAFARWRSLAGAGELIKLEFDLVAAGAGGVND